MEAQSALKALLDIWEELPALLGRAWADLFAALDRLFVRLKATDDPDERASLAADLVLLFRPYPAVAQRLRQRMQSQTRRLEDAGEADRGAEGTRAAVDAWSATLAALDAKLNGSVVTRYTDITAPRQLALARRGVITVGLTRAPSPESEAAQPLEVRLRQFLEVYLQSRPQDFEVIGERVKPLPIEPERDTEPVVFYIKSLSLGTKSLFLDFRQGGITVGEVRLVIEVTKETLPEEQVQALVGTVAAGGPYAPPPDLDIRVTTATHDGQTVIEYVLHSPNGTAGYHYQPVPGRTIKGSPEAVQARLMQKIEALGRGKDVDGSPLTAGQIDDRLKALGRSLYDELFSPEMRAAYRQFRDRVQTVQITSDEPWIPWEIMRPYDDSDPANVIDDDFLCMKFRLTRWLAGRGGPGQRIRVSRLACIAVGQAPDQPPLPCAGSERQYLADLARSQPGVADLTPQEATLPAVEALLDAGGVGLWHFAAHGNVDLRYPDESVIVLADGRALRPENIHGPRQTHISQDRPLIFINACRVGEQGWTLTRLGGWAAALVDRSRCGAFVGPLWAVKDRLAYAFVVAFYDALRRGETIGVAVHLARQRAKELRPENPTYLAYSVYAHPNARLEFAGQ